MNKHCLIYGLAVALLTSVATAGAQTTAADPCAGSSSVDGNSYGASVSSVTTTEIDVNLSICWSGPGTVRLGLGFPKYSLKFRDSSGSLIATISLKGMLSPGHPVYIHTNGVLPAGNIRAPLPSTPPLHGTYMVTASQTFAYKLPGSERVLSGTLVSAPFEVRIP